MTERIVKVLVVISYEQSVPHSHRSLLKISKTWATSLVYAMCQSFSSASLGRVVTSRNPEPNTMAQTFRGITYQVSCQTIAETRNGSFYVCLLAVKTEGPVKNEEPSGGKRSQM
jgi:hypothetical protein